MNPKPFSMLEFNGCSKISVSFDHNFRNRCSFALAFGMMIGVGIKDFGYNIFLIVDLELK